MKWIQQGPTQHSFQVKTENFFMHLVVHLHNYSILGALNTTLKWFQEHIFKMIPLLFPCTQICKTGDVMHMYIMCLHSVSLQRDIANYWPGMHNTVFLFVCLLWFFADPCEQGSFWQCCHLYKKNAKEKLWFYHANAP